MEITRDALLRIVKATRMSMALAETLQNLVVGKGRSTWADEIAGFLKDAVFMMSKEELPSGKSYDDSMTNRILTGDLDDADVTDWILWKNRIYDRVNPDGKAVQQPAPNIMKPEDMQKLYRKNGGYLSPEGEWK